MVCCGRMWGTVLLTACAPIEVRYPGAASPIDGVEGSVEDPVYTYATYESTGINTCTAPSARDRDGPFERRVSEAPEASTASMWSGGLIVADFNADGHTDAIAPSEALAGLYQGLSDGELELVKGYLSAFDLSFGSGGSAADVDGDGDLDALILRYDEPNRLLINDGFGMFVESEAFSEVAPSIPSTASTWADFDMDGDLDLFVAGGSEVDRGDSDAGPHLYENVGQGVLVLRPEALPVDIPRGATWAASFHDMDDDLDPDLLLVQGVGTTHATEVMWNVDGSFERGGEPGGHRWHGGSGLGVGDVNGDGMPDVLVPRDGAVSLQVSQPDGLWTDAGDALRSDGGFGLERYHGWGGDLADLNNDGLLDAVVAFGAIGADAPDAYNAETRVGSVVQPGLERDALWIQQADGSFEEQSRDWGVNDEGAQRGFVVADINDDGWLDLLKRDAVGPSTYYVSRCGFAHWVRVQLRDETSNNPFGIGAKIRVVAADGTSWTRWMTAGGASYASGAPAVAHVGVGEDRGWIDHIEVTWVDGAVSKVAFGESVDQTFVVIRN